MMVRRRTLDIPEVAAALGLSRGKTYALARSGMLPVLRLGRRVVVPKAALDRLLAPADPE